MEHKPNIIESLLERATEYGKSSYELAKLKALDKTSDIASTVIPHAIAIVLIATFMLFLSLGFAFWLGEILGKIYLGFYVVAAFYGIIGILIYFFMHKWLKKLVRNYIIKQVSK